MEELTTGRLRLVDLASQVDRGERSPYVWQEACCSELGPDKDQLKDLATGHDILRLTSQASLGTV